MKVSRSLVSVLTILIVLTLVVSASNGVGIGLVFFLTGAAIISIGRYTTSFLTSKH